MSSVYRLDDRRSGWWEQLRSQPWLVIGAVPLVGFAIWALWTPRVEGDTLLLVAGSKAIRSCFGDSVLTGCPGVNHFALAQYLPSTILGAIGVSDAAIARFLARLSTICFVVMIVVTWRALRYRSPQSAYLGVLAIASGPVLYYSRSSFGEGLAALLVLVFVVSILRRRPWPIVAIAALAAGITKETAVPFLLLLGISAVLLDRDRPLRDARATFIGMTIGCLLAIGTNVGFNLFRFGEARNAQLLDPLFRVPTKELRASFFLGQWFSPSGGLLAIWPLAILVLVIATFAAVRAFRRAGQRRRFWGTVVVAAVPFALTVGFAMWVAPFGWIAWGHRFMIVWIPAIVVLALISLSAESGGPSHGDERPSRMRMLTLASVASVVALPNLASLMNPERTLGRYFYKVDEGCPRPAILQENAAYYYQCVEHVIWGRTPPLTVEALDELPSPTGLVTVAGFIVFAAAIACHVGRKSKIA